ncbi:hypothetical protein B0T10DRAFT_580976 [Thelonectria olida]|uniref:Ubiquitin-like protease family profile domain-containing protein n=1 Tax=Thelonectria olida TaxID=1576542 RepID=A0A9P8VZI9_9HYPO|nr:hypothetical protein B0T10DRAFT_580976 [Thelonectria olida]
MSPSSRLTKVSEPSRQTTHMASNQLERSGATPERPSVEPLTPECLDDNPMPLNADGSVETEPAIQSLVNRIRLPLSLNNIIDIILQIAGDSEQLSEGLRLALSTRSAQEQHRIQSFARSLRSNCDELHGRAADSAIQEINPVSGSSQEEFADSVADTTHVGNSQSAIPSIEPMHPKRTPDPGLDLLEQSIEEFVNESCQQVLQFSSSENSPETYKALFASLGNEPCKDGTKWSDGSEWVSLVEAGHTERSKGSIRYALTATAFARWHASQVQLMEGAVGATGHKAAKAVSGRILGPKPEADKTKKELWERRRKNLSTHLARGRKWSRLWRNSVLASYSRMRGSPEKMTVLKLLTEQMSLLLETGRTNQDKFHDDLESEGLLISEPGSSTRCEELDAFYEKVQESTTGNILLVNGIDFRFQKHSLRRLSATTWLNEEIILSYLHLSDKLSFVRVGFSVPIHRQTRAHTAIPRPFERAAKQMTEWHRQAEAQSHLVCFYPLFQRQNHFSLLQINEREGSIYQGVIMKK